MYFLVAGSTIKEGTYTMATANTGNFTVSYHQTSTDYNYTQNAGFRASSMTFNSAGALTFSIPYYLTVSDGCTYNLAYSIQWTPPGGSTATIASSTISSIGTSGTISGTVTPTTSSSAGNGTLKVTLTFTNTRLSKSYSCSNTLSIGYGKLYTRYLRSSGSWVKQL